MESPTPSTPVLERRAITVKNRVQCKHDQVITWLQEFYKAPGNLEKLLPVLQGKSPISLRLIDYFVTNYAKKTNTMYNLDGKHFLVHFNYKRELNAYSKRLFDPFCRRERIMFTARGEEPFMTTVGQLNFFRWFIEKRILEFMTENRETIERDMNMTLKEHYSRSTTTSTATGQTEPAVATTGGGSAAPSVTTSAASTLSLDSAARDSVGSGGSRKKRCELTQSAMKKTNLHECEVTISFS
jgi:hypothetical protein